MISGLKNLCVKPKLGGGAKRSPSHTSSVICSDILRLLVLGGAHTVLGTPYYISPEMCEGKVKSCWAF